MKAQMNIEEAKKILNKCVRSELRDHAFGDREIFWFSGDADKAVATGYVGNGSISVGFTDGTATFKHDEARQLL